MRMLRHGLLAATALAVLAACGGSATLTVTETSPTPTPAIAVASPVPSPGIAAPLPTEPAGAPTAVPAVPTVEPVGYFPPEMVERALALAETAEPPSLPGRDLVATQGVLDELITIGIDLADVDLAVYPAGRAPSFVLITGSEEARALDSTEVGDQPSNAEVFLTAVLRSPTLEQLEIEQLVIEFAGSDDEGPFLVTFRMPFGAAREAVATDTDLGIDQVSVQVRRT